MRNYAYVVHPIRGLVKFDLYPFQVKIVRAIQANRFNIVRKFRQAGATTIASLYATWLAIFRTHKTIPILSIGDRESKEVLERIVLAFDELPSFLKPRVLKRNEHVLELETGSKIKSIPSAKTSSRGISGSWLVVDEAAFIETIGELWKAAYPTLSTGGAALIISTVNGMAGPGAFFYETYKNAMDGSNSFNPIDIHWREHPEYHWTKGYEDLYEEMLSRDPPIDINEWEETTRKNVGYRGWLQEYECQFLGTGDTFIDGETLTHLTENISTEYYVKLNNRLRVWKDPEPHYQYILCADPALGLGRNYSAFHIINLYNGNIEAEFYSNKTPIEEFADIMAKEGWLYNNAYITWDRTTIGMHLKYHLFDRIGYDNLFIDPNDPKSEFGVILSAKNREVSLAKLEEYIRTQKIRIKSQRTIDELLSFIVNKGGKAEADEGKQDDLVMSLAVGVYSIGVLAESTPFEKPLLNTLGESPLEPDNKKGDPFMLDMKDSAGVTVSREDYKWILGYN
jgi:hypothetical protein